MIFHDALRDLEDRLAKLLAQRATLDERERVLTDAIESVKALLYLDDETDPTPPVRQEQRTIPGANSDTTKTVIKRGHTDEVKRRAFVLLAEGKSQAETARILGVSAYAIHDWSERSKWDEKYMRLAAIVTEPGKMGGGGKTHTVVLNATCVDCGGPRSKYSAERCKTCYHARAEARRAAKSQQAPEPTKPVEPNDVTSEVPPLRAKNLTVTERVKEGPEAKQRLKDHEETVRRAPSERVDPRCGRCITRVINDTPYFAAQPDCPVHGLGLGVAQPGRERGPDI